MKNANSDPIVNGNSGVLAISASLTDKGLANRDQVVAAIFSYLNLLREKGSDKQYFDELANVLDIDFRYPSITRDMDYVEWLADTMIRVPVEHTLDAVWRMCWISTSVIRQSPVIWITSNGWQIP